MNEWWCLRGEYEQRSGGGDCQGSWMVDGGASEWATASRLVTSKETANGGTAEMDSKYILR